jgi:hypothetical protein
VAGSAVSVNRFYFLQGTPVAVIACNVNVCALKQKVGLEVVIKRPGFPGDRVVTVLTLGLEVAAMWVIFEMARHALALSLAENL